MARQYFNSQIADSLIVSGTTGSITTATSFLSINQNMQAFPLPYGVNSTSAPFAGQVFRFTCGGIMTTGTAGTLIINAYHGPGSSTTAFGTTLATSVTQNYVPSLTNVAWRMEGELVYRTISMVSTTSTAWLVGCFWATGAVATAGSGVVIPFSSSAAVSVDTTGLAANLFGSLGFSATFSVASTITTQYTSMQSLN